MNRIYGRLAALAAAVSGLAACDSGNGFLHELTLSTDAVVMPAEESWHVIAVYAENDWQASFSETAEWAALDVTQGVDGIGRIRLDCKANTGLKRAVKVVVTDGVNSDTLKVSQAAGVASPEFAFVKSSLEVPAGRTTVATAFSTNLTGDLERTVVAVKDTAGEDADWITDVTVGTESVVFNVSRTVEDRMAVLTLVISDSDGTELVTSLSVVQKSGL